ncbi:EspA/EspE family type VII secretion system effector [Mycobacterium sp. 4858]|uniref:EspA/EspE family type VII secretion system effector n=1 Tax=Mycobacterium sp. 4858 TaxID=2057185 RepID=UPI00115B71C3|nr:EspA/EspE family type VII secretion system effector [Mycobacterium sp. 4858]
MAMVVAASEIGGLVGSLAGIGKNAAAKDWVATGIGGGAFAMETTKIAVKAIVERRIKAEIERGLEERTNPWAAEVPIIEWGIVAITVFEYFLGLGDASKGAEFDNARSKLDSPKKDLESAFPDSGWEGSASEEYAKQNRAQLDRVNLMRDQDQAMMEILTAEVDQLTEIRRAVAGIKDGLTGCIFVALLIKAQGSEASSLVFQKVVTIAAITATVGAIGYMEFFSGTETRPKVQEVVREYEKIIAEMKDYLSTSRIAPSARMAPSAESTVSDFATESTSSALTGTSTPAGTAAPVTAPRLSELIQMSGRPVQGMPTPAQPVEASAQAGQVAAPAPTPTSPVSAQPSPSTARQRKAPAAAEGATTTGAGPEDTIPSDGAEVVGAAAGTGAAERAPAEVAALKAEQPADPNRPQPAP